MIDPVTIERDDLERILSLLDPFHRYALSDVPREWRLDEEDARLLDRLQRDARRRPRQGGAAEPGGQEVSPKGTDNPARKTSGVVVDLRVIGFTPCPACGHAR